jgi:hypothetical protein
VVSVGRERVGGDRPRPRVAADSPAPAGTVPTSGRQRCEGEGGRLAGRVQEPVGGVGGRQPGTNGRTCVSPGACARRLKQFRAVATRYDKREYMFQGTIDVASIRIRLRDPFHDPGDTPSKCSRRIDCGVSPA